MAAPSMRYLPSCSTLAWQYQSFSYLQALETTSIRDETTSALCLSILNAYWTVDTHFLSSQTLALTLRSRRWMKSSQSSYDIELYRTAPHLRDDPILSTEVELVDGSNVLDCHRILGSGRSSVLFRDDSNHSNEQEVVHESISPSSCDTSSGRSLLLSERNATYSEEREDVHESNPIDTHPIGTSAWSSRASEKDPIQSAKRGFVGISFSFNSHPIWASGRSSSPLEKDPIPSDERQLVES